MNKPSFKILSIDGGGIRGVIPCTILKYVEEQTGMPVSSLFNLAAGTSTGGIIALGLTRRAEKGKPQPRYSAEAMRDLYVKFGQKIFSKRPGGLLSWVSSKLFDKPYEHQHLESLLNEYFGDFTLRESLLNVLITTYEIEKGKPFYFSSRLAKQSADENFLLTQIARSTSAAPTYFQPSIVQYQNELQLAFVDGGVFANNPSVLAYGEAKELWKARVKKQNNQVLVETGTKGFEPVISADDDDYPFYMLSLGTGYSPNTIIGADVKDYRNKDWFEPLMTNIFMRSVANSTHFTMQHLLPPYEDGTDRYHRLDFEIPEECAAMDDASAQNINTLIDKAEAFIERNKKQLDEICNILS